MRFAEPLTPGQLAMLTTVLDEHCSAHSLTHDARAEVAEQLIALYRQGTDSPEGLAAALRERAAVLRGRRSAVR